MLEEGRRKRAGPATARETRMQVNIPYIEKNRSQVTSLLKDIKAVNDKHIMRVETCGCRPLYISDTG